MVSNDKESSGFLRFNDCFFGNMMLKPTAKEETDFKLLNSECFDYLYAIYGGTDLRRFSIDVGGGDFLVET